MNKTTNEQCSVSGSININSSNNYDLIIDAVYNNPTNGVNKSNRYSEINISQAIMSQREVLIDFDKLIALSTTGIFSAT